MALTISGQRPAALDPVHTLPIIGDYDPIPAIRSTIVEPLFAPITPGATVTIVDQNSNAMDDDDVLNLLLSCVGDDVNAAGEIEFKSLLQQGLIHYDQSTPLLVNELYVSQAAMANRLPHPGPKTLYTAAMDVIPAAKSLMGGPDTGAFLASIGYTYSPEALGFWFQNDAAFEDFKTWLDQEVSTLSAVLPGDTTSLLTKFGATNLNGLIEGYVLRATDDDANEEYSFARIIVHMLMKYQRQHAAGWGAQPQSGVLPFVVSELYLPRTILLVNVEAHARATPRRVESEWRLVKNSIASPVKMVSNKALSKLTALPRAMAKASAQAANSASNRRSQMGKSAKVAFRKQPPTKVEIETGVVRALKRMKEVARSQNVLKKTKTSYARANRRDPMDYNRPGRSVSTHYLPDLHIYVDTSGSISEANYQDAVMMLIKFAKKMNVNLYFNSFSHVLSQEVMIRTKGRSSLAIWKEFRKIPKVSGGTEYQQIWDYINMSPTRTGRFSLVITDFEWNPPSQRVVHPPNLHYAPCSSMGWERMTHWAKNYVTSMRHIEPAIAQRMIGIIV